MNRRCDLVVHSGQVRMQPSLMLPHRVGRGHSTFVAGRGLSDLWSAGAKALGWTRKKLLRFASIRLGPCLWHWTSCRALTPQGYLKWMGRPRGDKKWRLRAIIDTSQGLDHSIQKSIECLYQSEHSLPHKEQ